MNPIDVQKHLKGADYPTTPQQLAELAERNGAPSEQVDRIRDMDGGVVSGPDDVMRRLG